MADITITETDTATAKPAKKRRTARAVPRAEGPVRDRKDELALRRHLKKVKLAEALAPAKARKAKASKARKTRARTKKVAPVVVATAPVEVQPGHTPPMAIADVLKMVAAMDLPGVDPDSLKVSENQEAIEASKAADEAANRPIGQSKLEELGKAVERVEELAVPVTNVLRPRKLVDFVGQPEAIRRLQKAIGAAKAMRRPAPSVLLEGPPGLGKTTLAQIIANEMAVGFKGVSGGVLSKVQDLADVLYNIREGDVLFVDEAHAMNRKAQERLGLCVEDHIIDVPVKGGGIERFNIQPFTLVAATTMAGDLSKPLLDRFGLTVTYDYYSTGSLARIVLASAERLGMYMEPEAAGFLAGRSRGTPRIANRLLERARDMAVMESTLQITPRLVMEAMDLEGIDEHGLTGADWRYMETLYYNFNGGPAGCVAIAATMQVNPNTLAEKVEPYLLRMGYVLRTPGGRVLSQPMRDLVIARKGRKAA